MAEHRTHPEPTLPDFLDPSRPSASRVYDYLLGGYHNFPADRQAAEQIRAVIPTVSYTARSNRAFLRRALTHLINLGIDQVLDIGSGIPTLGNVHEIAHQINPQVRVVYVDIDPVAVQHSLAILHEQPGELATTTAIQADLRIPQQIFDHPETRRLIDFDRPLVVILLAVLHLVTDDAEAGAIVTTLRDRLAPGSYMVISHPTDDWMTSEESDGIEAVTSNLVTPGFFRRRSQIEPWFAGLELLPPGLVATPAWRPEEPGGAEIVIQSMLLAGVGHKV
jgi:hypothetical protein